jgi:hypothetical protein
MSSSAYEDYTTQQLTELTAAKKSLGALPFPGTFMLTGPVDNLDYLAIRFKSKQLHFLMTTVKCLRTKLLKRRTRYFPIVLLLR